MFKIALAIMSIAALLIGSERVSFAQAGSIGGTLGKTDKSASGSDTEKPSTKKPVPRHSVVASHTETSVCGRIVGTWKWGIGYTVIIKSDGTATHGYAGNGKWTCKDGQYIFVWSAGITDHISISSDGNKIEGSNSLGMNFSGTRF